MDIRGLELELKRRAREHNRDAGRSAIKALALGVIGTAIMSAYFYWVWWFLWLPIRFDILGVGVHRWCFALWMVGLFVEAGLRKRQLVWLLTGRGDKPEPGWESDMSVYVLGGPLALIEGLSQWRLRVPDTGASAREGATALARLANARSTEIRHKDAGRLLVGLGLAIRSDAAELPVYFATNRAAFVVREQANSG